MSGRLPITPETGVGDLLDAYPELEEMLESRGFRVDVVRSESGFATFVGLTSG